jgi:S-formylglutathione hydrolase
VNGGASVYEVCTMPSGLVSSPMTYSVLRPAGAEGALPLVLWLHGGGGSNDFLEAIRGVFEQCWADGSLPPVVVATPAAGRSFYLNRVDGTEQWELAILEELIPHLRATTGAGDAGAPVLVGGVSMGGMGSLRLALKYPTRFAAVAAMEPGIEPSPSWSHIQPRDRIYRSDDVVHALFGNPVDEEYFTANHPLGIIERNAAAIVASGLGIYLEVGDEDFLHLHHGAEAFHRRMFDLRIRHEYRLVRHGDHTGPTLPPRMADALGFLGRQLAGRPEPPAERRLTAAFIAQGEAACGYRRSLAVDRPGGVIEVGVLGTGPMVVLLPSLGRGADDFEDLSRSLAAEGYTTVCPQPRGVAGSTAPLEGLTMADLADDVAEVVTAVGGPGATATIVGHAFGNRVARMTATRRPEVVRDVVLLGCGGRVSSAPEHHAALVRVFEASLPPDEHIAAVAQAFFADGNDPSAWADGWYPDLARAQGAATSATPVDAWWTAGTAPVLIVQPEHDRIAPAGNADALVAELGPRSELVLVPHAGHALLPEQPDAVVTVLLRWLRR